MLDLLHRTTRYSPVVITHETGPSVTPEETGVLELFVGQKKLKKFVGGLHHIHIAPYSIWGCQDPLSAVPSRIYFGPNNDNSRWMHVWLRDPKVWLSDAGYTDDDGRHLMRAVVQGRLYGHPEARRGAAAVFSDMTFVFTNGRRWNFWELGFPDEKSQFRIERPKALRAGSKARILEHV